MKYKTGGWANLARRMKNTDWKELEKECAEIRLEFDKAAFAKFLNDCIRKKGGSKKQLMQGLGVDEQMFNALMQKRAKPEDCCKIIQRIGLPLSQFVTEKEHKYFTT